MILCNADYGPRSTSQDCEFLPIQHCTLPAFIGLAKREYLVGFLFIVEIAFNKISYRRTAMIKLNKQIVPMTDKVSNGAV